MNALIPPQVIGADWLIPMNDADPGGAIRRGGVRIDSRGIITAVGPFDELAHAADRRTFFESAVLTPGLINAHAHLDMSYWKGHRDSLAGKPLHDWVVPIVAERVIRPAGEVADAAAAGAAESLAAGVTTVVDVTPASIAWCEVLAAVAAVPIRRMALAEVVGFGPRGRQFWAAAKRAVAANPRPSRERKLAGATDSTDAPASFRSRLEDQSLLLGISPHAPYSTGAEIYSRCLAAARAGGMVLMTHLSESAEEVEFCRTGQGPWRKRLEQLGGAVGEDRGRGREGSPGSQGFCVEIPHCSPVEYAEQLGLLDYPRTLLAHVNYLEPGDLDRLAGGRAAVVYCPRTADFFGHRDHPWRRMLAAGVNVVLGTDSLASAPDLAMLGELRFLHERHPGVLAADLFAMVTRNAAAAIGQSGRLGQLVPGAYADLVAWPINSTGPDIETILNKVIELCPAPVAVQVGQWWSR